MEFKCKVIVESEDYMRKFQQYEKDLKDFENNLPEDSFIREALEINEPQPPEPQYSTSVTTVRDDLIIGYEILDESTDPKYDGEKVFKVYFDQSRFYYGYFITLHDDKIIRKLDNLLQRKI